MWYGNTKSLLESALRQLHSGETSTDDDWNTQTGVVETCLAEMVQKAESTGQAPSSADSRYVHRPATDKLNRAMPHVRAMLAAMRTRDRLEALKHGTEAIHRL
jgi:hypothetical protein